MCHGGLKLTVNALNTDRYRPHVRDCLIANPHFTFEQYANAYNLTSDIDWPYGEDLIFIEEVLQDETMIWRMNPVYEKHLRNLENWLVGSTYQQFLPKTFGDAVEKSVRQFGGYH